MVIQLDREIRTESNINILFIENRKDRTDRKDAKDRKDTTDSQDRKDRKVSG